MQIITSSVKKVYTHFSGDSLRKNSLLLILSQAVNAGSAFIFWIICARLFTSEQVGLATAFISFGSLVSAFTNLGLPNTIIRFLPVSKRRGSIFMAAILLIMIASLIGSVLAIAFIHTLSAKLAFIQQDPILIVLLSLLILGNTTSALLDGTLMAFREGKYIFRKAIITNLPRILLPFIFVGFAIKGMLAIYVIMLAVGVTYNMIIVCRKLLKNDVFYPVVHELVKHKSYAASNYFGGMLGVLPSTLVPIIVLNRLGAEQAAYFFIPMQIAAFLNIISSSTSQALMSESSQSDKPNAYKKHLGNALKQLYRLLGLGIAATILLGWPVLRLYGSNYAANGFIVLVMLALASLFVAVNWLGDTLLNIQKRVVAYFIMNGLNAAAVIISVYLFAAHGLLGVSIGWIVAQAFSALTYVFLFARPWLRGIVSGSSTS